MAFQAGEVVTLKSGGMPMTVAEVGDDGVLVLWLGEEGDLFRETLPEAVLTAVATLDDEKDDEDDEADADDEEDEDEEDEDKEKARKVA